MIIHVVKRGMGGYGNKDSTFYLLKYTSLEMSQFINSIRLETERVCL